jgi:DNA-binding NtrC family response regulator
MASTKQCILVVEDGTTEREALARVLRLEHYEVLTARNSEEALAAIHKPIDLVVSDLRLGRESGIDLLRAWRRQRPHTPCIMLTAFGSIDTAVAAMKLGAEDFLTKPVDPEQLLNLIRRTLTGDSDSSSDQAVLQRINAGLHPNKIIGRSRALVEVCEQALRAAETSSTVLLLGESGTGKELIAEALHRHSGRRDGPLVIMNLAAIPGTLVESELFGHVKGAFTSATSNRQGHFEAAHGGTLFIDEIGDFPLPLQPKLLRVLETHTINAVGSNRVIPVDVRVVAATSRPLAKMTQNGEFREELYYRLNIVTIHLPPLRQRRQDIPLLVQHFLSEFASTAGRKPPRVAPELMRELEGLDWPGNVRQLRNCLERMSVLGRSEILTPADLPLDLREPADETADAAGARLESVKRSAILQALEQFDGNRTRAAEFLGISVRTLQRKLREWGTSKSTYGSEPDA